MWLCAHQEHLPLTAWPVAGTVLLSDQSGTLEAPLDGEMLRLEGGGGKGVQGPTDRECRTQFRKKPRP